MYSIAISRRAECPEVADAQLQRVVASVLSLEGVNNAEISVAIVSDAEIHDLNREFLGHDYPTDVVTFSLNDAPASADQSPPGEYPTVQENAEKQGIEGELVVSVETARREAVAAGWSPADELLLYCIHGILHLCGYDDHSPDERRTMRRREREVMNECQLPLPPEFD